jgi:transposase
VTSAPDNPPDDIDALRGALAAERLARREAEARASGAEGLDQWSKRWRTSSR